MKTISATETLCFTYLMQLTLLGPEVCEHYAACVSALFGRQPFTKHTITVIVYFHRSGKVEN